MKWTPHKLLPIPTDDEVAVMEPAELVELYNRREKAIRNEESDPYYYGYEMPSWKRSWDLWKDYRVLLLLGANRCIAPDQIIHDPVADKSTPVSEITGDFHVWAWDGAKKVVARAEKPFQKPQSRIYRVVLSSGEFLDCSKAHRLLTPDGWKSVGTLSPGDELLNCSQESSPSLHPSISERNHGSFLSSAYRWIQKALSFPANYCSYLRQCGEPLRNQEGISRSFPPSQDDAPIRSNTFGNIRRWISGVSPQFSQCKLDGRACKSSSIHSWLEPFRLSILDGLRQIEGRDAGILCHASGRPSGSAFGQHGDQKICGVRPRSILEFCLRKPKPATVQSDTLSHCVLPCSDDGQLAPNVKIEEIYFLRNDWVWDFTVPEYHNYIAAGVISHNSSKSEFGAKTVVKAAMENPKSLIYCFSQNEETSLLVQQPAIYKYLPSNLKTKATSAVQYISYKAQTGFAERSLILPNGSRIIFKFYSQWQQDDKILEGMALGSPEPTWRNVGAWLDEYLLGMDLLDRLFLRLATHGAQMLLTFTPKDGITETVGNFINGATTKESRKTKVFQDLHAMPEKDVPSLQINERKSTCLVYFHTEDNPWGGYEECVEICKAKSDWKYTLTALYGVPTKSYTTKFPKFSTQVNVVSPDKIPTKNITRYQIIDPAGKKSWFMAWIAVTGDGTYYVYREYPGVDIGEWAQQGKNGKWVEGEGAKTRGQGLRDYVEETYMAEGKTLLNKEWKGGEEIHERLIDPRLGAARYQGEDRDSSIIEDLDALGFVVMPAPGDHIEDGLQKLVDLMAYDTTKEIDGLNRPHFYVSSECENIIQALQEYTGDDGLKEAWKDCIDTLRYAAAADIDYCDSKSMMATCPGGNGY